MYEKGTYDVGCGTFSYNIHKAAAGEPILGDEVADLIPYERHCHKPEDLPPLRGDVHGNTVLSNSGFACAGRALPEYAIRKDNKTSFSQQAGLTIGGAPYQYNIWWKPGCRIEKNGGPTAISAYNPFLQKSGPGPDFCQRTLWENWEKCGGNGGRGGYIQLGCLMYEFVASSEPRKF